MTSPPKIKHPMFLRNRVEGTDTSCDRHKGSFRSASSSRGTRLTARIRSLSHPVKRTDPRISQHTDKSHRERYHGITIGAYLIATLVIMIPLLKLAHMMNTNDWEPIGIAAATITGLVAMFAGMTAFTVWRYRNRPTQPNLSERKDAIPTVVPAQQHKASTTPKPPVAGTLPTAGIC